MALTKQERRIRINTEFEKNSGTAEKPRMSVFRSNKQIYIQLIDDVQKRIFCLYHPWRRKLPVKKT